MKAYALALPLIIVLSAPTFAEEIIGPARIIDGDTLVIGGTHIRIWGIDAFEARQQCHRPDGDWPCGAMATILLQMFTEHYPVICTDKGRDRYNRTVATCTANGIDLGSTMVSIGYALDWPKYSHGYYAYEQELAAKTKTGGWSGTFTIPWDWRRNER